MESALRHGISTITSVLAALVGLVGIIVAWLADTPAPAGIPAETWVSIGKFGVAALAVIKTAQAVATILGQHFGTGPAGTDELDAGPAPESLPEG